MARPWIVQCHQRCPTSSAIRGPGAHSPVSGSGSHKDTRENAGCQHEKVLDFRGGGNDGMVERGTAGFSVLGSRFSVGGFRGNGDGYGRVIGQLSLVIGHDWPMVNGAGGLLARELLARELTANDRGPNVILATLRVAWRQRRTAHGSQKGQRPTPPARMSPIRLRAQATPRIAVVSRFSLVALLVVLLGRSPQATQRVAAIANRKSDRSSAPPLPFAPTWLPNIARTTATEWRAALGTDPSSFTIGGATPRRLCSSFRVGWMLAHVTQGGARANGRTR